MSREFSEEMRRAKEMLEITSKQKMQIETRMRYQSISIQLARIEISDNSKCWRSCGSIGSHIFLVEVLIRITI